MAMLLNFFRFYAQPSSKHRTIIGEDDGVKSQTR